MRALKESYLITGRSILLVRTIALAAGLFILLLSYFGFKWLTISHYLILLFIAKIVWVGLGWLRLYRQNTFKDTAIFKDLFGDIVLLSMILYFTGGSSNPFISYFFIIIALAAVNLNQGLCWYITIFAIISYTGLTFGQHDHSHHIDQAFNLHLIGMWINFSLSAILMTFFVSAIARSLNAREKLLAIAREESLLDEKILAMGILAANTAHELSTPLSTVGILLEEARNTEQELSTPDIELSILQIRRCREIISRLSQIADYKAIKAEPPRPVPEFIDNLKTDLALLKPDATINWELEQKALHLLMSSDPTLTQAVLNILLNAIEASRSDVSVSITNQEQFISIAISDDGPGISSKILQNVGQETLSTKKYGIGIGLFLSNASIERLQGSIQIKYTSQQGSCVQIKIPILKESDTIK